MIRFRRSVALALFLAAVTGSAVGGVYDDMLVAIRNDDSAKVMALLDRGMDVNTADQNGMTLTMYAARAGNEKLLEFLLSHRSNPLNKNNTGETALAFSAFGGYRACAEQLVRAGAEVNPAEGWSPLSYAAFNGHLEVAEYLISQGAKIDALAPNGMTALMLAARNGHLAMVKLLLGHGADARFKTPDGKTARDIALAGNENQIAELLNGLP